MDDAGRGGTLGAVFEDVGHDIVPDLFFLLSSEIVIDVFDVGFELGDHFGGDDIIETQLMLCLGQSNPAFTPGGELGLFGKETLHLLAGVPADKWLLIYVTGVCCHNTFLEGVNNLAASLLVLPLEICILAAENQIASE